MNYLHEEEISAGICAAVDSEGLSVDLAGWKLLEINVVSCQLSHLVQD